jgi:tungstate transport system ATP-binding protein
VLLRRSAAANLRHALALAGVRGSEATRRIAEALSSVGLEAIADRAARVLSGGEQQRLALARAWALAPEVLFLDEPTASLDPTAARAVEAIVRDIGARGTTIVMTTHQLAQARRLADDVVVLSAGRVAEHTQAVEFFRQPASEEGRQFLEGERL